MLRRDLDPVTSDVLQAEVVRLLSEGRVVVVPTETRYAALSPALADLGDAAVRLLGGIGELRAAGGEVTPPAQRLARRYWPGPLTLRVPVPGGELDVRVPGLAFVREVVQAAGAPVYARELADTLEGSLAAWSGPQPALAVDAGRTQLAAAPTLVRTSPVLEVVEEGFLDRAAIHKTALREVLFVCTGNTCRSPMAEAMFRQRLAEELGVASGDLAAAGWEVGSAGVSAGSGSPASPEGVEVMAERGLDISRHRSRQLTEELVDRAALIVGLSPSHFRAIGQDYPEVRDKLAVLDPRGVPDPIGGPLQLYRETADHIASRFGDLIQEHFAGGDLPNGPALPPAPATPCDPARIFPAAGDVPAAFDLEHTELGLSYLVAGEVRHWQGATAAVESVFCEPGPDGALVRRELGPAAQLTGEVALEALAAARAAWDLGRGEWPTMPVRERLERLRGLADALVGVKDEVVRLLMWEIGKTHADAAKEVDRTVAYIDATVQAMAENLRLGSGLRSAGGVLAQLRRAPLGVCLCMGPFNYPLNETLTTVVPALAMGNVCLIKLPKHGLLANQPLLSAFAELFPPGVVNVLSGDGATLVSPLMESGQLDVLAFIGSSRVAGIIERQHPEPYRLTTVLGLDAKNPAVVLPDADVEQAVESLVEGALSFNGQRCTALKLIFAPRALAPELARRLGEAVEALPAGMMWQEGVRLTPLPEPGKAEALTGLLEDAVAKGAEVVNAHGGQHQGTFFFPAVLYPVSKDARLYSEEQFGPLVPVVPYDDLDEVQQALAESPYGQQVSVYGQDPAVIGPLLDRLVNQVCRVNLNRACQRGPDHFPFAGRKRSAEGVLSIFDALETFSLPAVIATGDDGPGRSTWEQLLHSRSSKFLGG